MVLANLIFWIALQQRNTTIVYYLTYNLDRKDLVPLINSLATIQILFIIAIPFFSKYLAKTWIWVGGLLVATFGGVMMWLAADNITFLIAAWILGNIGSGIACSMPFAMLGFAVDFGAWKTGIKATGILIAFGSTFCIKMGSGLGTAFAAWIMNSFGYVPNHAQSAAGLEALSGPLSGTRPTLRARSDPTTFLSQIRSDGREDSPRSGNRQLITFFTFTLEYGRHHHAIYATRPASSGLAAKRSLFMD